jgi:hypothetical protein
MFTGEAKASPVFLYTMSLYIVLALLFPLVGNLSFKEDAGPTYRQAGKPA